MTDVHNTTDLKTTPIPEQQLAGPGCAHLTGLPVLSPMSVEHCESLLGDAASAGAQAGGPGFLELLVAHGGEDG